MGILLHNFKINGIYTFFPTKYVIYPFFDEPFKKNAINVLLNGPDTS